MVRDRRPHRFFVLLSTIGILLGAVVVLAATAVPASLAAGPDRGPVAAYSFDEGEGTTAEDLTGDGHTATLEGAEWARGRYGDGLRFDGKTACATVADAADLRFGEEFTVESWVRPEGPRSKEPLLVKKGGSFSAYSLGIGSAVGEASIGTTAGGREAVSGSSLEAKVWRHLAATFDGAKLRLYVGGALIATRAVASPNASGLGSLTIGCDRLLGTHFTGRIDEARVYNRALAEAEIQQSMYSTFPVAVTEAVQEVESNDAIMTGTTHVRGEGTEYFFEYGPTTSYGSVATGEEIEGNGETVEVEEVAVNLAPETTYHYRLAAEGSLGTAYGKDQTFTTGARTMSVEEEEEERRAEEAPLTEEEVAPNLVEPLAEPGNFFGMMWDGNIAQMVRANTFDAIENSGAKMFRFVVAPGAEVSKSFNNAASHNLTPLPYLGQGAFPKPGTEAATNFINYAKNMVQTHRSEADTWEIWNEPNMRFQLNPGQIPPIFETNQVQGNVRPAEFAAFYKELVKGIRSVSTGVHILTPGLFGYRASVKGHLTPRSFLKQFNEALETTPKLENPYGSVSLHPYVFKTRTAEDVKRHRGAHAPKDEEDAKQVRNEVKGMIKGVRKLEKHMLGENKPIWVTELGFPVRSEEDGHSSKSIPPVDPTEQKLLLRASFAMLLGSRKSLEIEHAFYYNIEDLPGPSWEHHAGLLNENHRPRPAWTAFSTLADGKECPHSTPC
jgi:hypothetical protein